MTEQKPATVGWRLRLGRLFASRGRSGSPGQAPFVPGSPGYAQFEQARAAEEAATALLAKRHGLRLSDGTAAALPLLCEATWLTMAAHLAKGGDPAAAETEPDALWEFFISSQSGDSLGSLDEELLARARDAFVQGSFRQGCELDGAERRGRIEALRAVVERLLSPLRVAAVPPARRRALRVGGLVLAVLIVVGLGVGAWLAVVSFEARPNLALDKATRTNGGEELLLDAEGAVDGIIDALGLSMKPKKRPWLEIDLGEVKRICRVRVYNRTDCCRERLIPLSLQLGRDPKSYEIIARREKEFSRWTAKFSPTEARYVRLQVLAKRAVRMHLNEVEVYGCRR